jgi:phage FluMu protein Com
MFREVRCDADFKRPGLGGMCGQLLFRAESSDVEIKCPRCKQIKVIRLAQLAALVHATT